MPRQITLKIGRDGGVETELSGFPGQDCVSEAERLQRALAGLGLKLSLDDIAMKLPETVAAETSVDERKRTGRKQK